LFARTTISGTSAGSSEGGTTSSIQTRAVLAPTQVGGAPYLDASTQQRYSTANSSLGDLRAVQDSGTLICSFERTSNRFGIQSLDVLGVDLDNNNAVSFETTLHGGRGYENGGVACDVHNPTIAMACFTVFDGLSREVEFVRFGYDGRVAHTPISETVDLPRAPAITFARPAPGSGSERGEFVAVWGRGGSTHPLLGQDLPYSDWSFRPVVLRGSVDCAGVDELAAFVEPSLAGHGNFLVQLPQANGLSVLLVGTDPANVALGGIGMPGCQLNVTPALSIGGGPAVVLPLPSSLHGVNLHLQWVLAAPGANALGLQSTDGVLVRVR
jgi:hypothetical protein